MATAPPRTPAAATGWTFFAAMSVLVAVVIAAGFGPTYARALAPPGLPFWVHVHGAAMAGWIVLFAVQATLIRRRSLALHRTLGWASVGLVAVMLPLGVATNLLAIRRGATPPFFTPEMMFAADNIDLLLFVGLFAWALAKRRQAQWHKRLLLCATVLMTWPALGRLVGRSGADFALVVPISTALLFVLVLAGPVVDLVRRGRVHPAYLWGVGLIALAQPLHVVVANSAPAHALVAALQHG